MIRQVEFDIALSFAGEDREYVEQVALILESKGISIFYDKFEEANLWGKNLYEHLIKIYRDKAFYTVMFISENYSKKLWTDHERQAIQNRAFQENREYILPARFDNTEITGLLSTIGYINLKDKNPTDFSNLICKKLVLSGRTIPSEQIRKSASSPIKIVKSHPLNFKVTVKNEDGGFVNNSNLLLIADNNTYYIQKSDILGQVKFEINTRRKYKLFFSHENYSSCIIDEIDPENDIEILVNASDNIGSIVCLSTGYIPGLKGRLNPILDTSNQIYLYADNISINGGKSQPVTFKLNEPIQLEDCEGIIMQITVKDIQGNCSLLEFIKSTII